MRLGTPSSSQYYKIIGTRDSSPIYAMSVGYQLFCFDIYCDQDQQAG